MANHLATHLSAVRIQLKHTRNMLRTTMQMVAELESLVAADHIPGPKEAEGRNGSKRSSEVTRV